MVDTIFLSHFVPVVQPIPSYHRDGFIVQSTDDPRSRYFPWSHREHHRRNTVQVVSSYRTRILLDRQYLHRREPRSLVGATILQYTATRWDEVLAGEAPSCGEYQHIHSFECTVKWKECGWTITIPWFRYESDWKGRLARTSTIRILIFVRLASLGERSASDTGLGWYDMKTLLELLVKLLRCHPLTEKN